MLDLAAMVLAMTANGNDAVRIGRALPPENYTATAARGAALFETAMLQGHASARAEHALPPLRWNPELAAAAHEWAQQLAASGGFEHSDDDSDDPQGENLWMGTRGAFAYPEMVKHWVDEKADFLPGRPLEASGRKGWEDIAHYTQIVWKDTREVGCAVASNAEDDYLVCRYYPAGNVEGETPLG